MKWIQWSVLTSTLFISLMECLLNPLHVWAHQRVMIPPAATSPSVTVTLMDSPFASDPTVPGNGYHITIHNIVTDATNGDFFLTKLLFSSQPPTNGDLPDVAPAFIQWSQDQGQIPLPMCRVGGSQTVSGPNGPGTEGSYTIPACPQSSTNASTLDWKPNPVSGPAPSHGDLALPGGKWMQAKLFSLPQLSDLDNLQTEADWLQFRIGESQAMYLPSLQGTSTPLEGTPTPVG